MEIEKPNSRQSVTVSVELTGEYDSVVSKLRGSIDESDILESVASDLARVLDTVLRLNGGTRSAIADDLPGDMVATDDAEAIVDVLQVLKRYDLVALEGNTWKPGPQLEEHS